MNDFLEEMEKILRAGEKSIGQAVLVHTVFLEDRMSDDGPYSGYYHCISAGVISSRPRELVPLTCKNSFGFPISFPVKKRFFVDRVESILNMPLNYDKVFGVDDFQQDNGEVVLSGQSHRGEGVEFNYYIGDRNCREICRSWGDGKPLFPQEFIRYIKSNS